MEGRRMTSRRRFIESSAALGSLALSPSTAFAQTTPTNVRVIFFGVASNLPVWCGIAKGFFAKQNLNVTTEITPSSVYMFQHLSAGDFDIAITAMDNVVAYDEGQGATDLKNPADFVAFMGGDNGMLTLWSRPDIRGYADLKGTTLAVDAVQTGFTFVLRRMLEIVGLNEGDYQLAAAGGTPKRFEALTTTAQYSAALLTAPFDLEADAKGCHKLGTALDIIGHYQAYTGVARRSWIAQNGDVLVRYIRGYLAALRWLYDGRNRTETIAILTKQGNVPPEIASIVYAEIIDRANGIVPNGAIDIAGVRTILELRSKYGLPKKTLKDPLKYIDESYWRRALH
jgi:ABC-type nitrate/sulfonate/bicarbonate transport system substrate-binding protein